MEVRRLFGRRMIFTDKTYIDRSNVVEVLDDAMFIHSQNRFDSDYLYGYYRGLQPIWDKKKEVRPEINNKVIENRANEIVSFKVGYLMGEPIQYVSLVESDEVAEQISKLNSFMLSEDKAAKDNELSEWAHVCGTSYRMVLPDSSTGDDDEAPFELYTLDPRNTFVVYQNSLGTPPIMAAMFIDTKEGGRIFSIYTKDRYFEVQDGRILKDVPQALGIPIFEYPLNKSRLGSFEIVITILDAINNVASNRIDAVEQFVQALMIFRNVQIDDKEYAKLREEGALMYRDVDPNFQGEIKYLVQELNQMQTQTLVDCMYNTVLTIVGMPNRNGGTSTSDTGSAVIMRDGWSAAEARAKDSETVFKSSERKFLKMVARICNDVAGTSLKASTIDIRFTRRNYENIASKAAVLTSMLANDKIAPELAFIHCGMFSDPNVAYRMSMEYYEKNKKKEASNDNQPVGEGGEGDQRDPEQREGS